MYVYTCMYFHGAPTRVYNVQFMIRRLYPICDLLGLVTAIFVSDIVVLLIIPVHCSMLPAIAPVQFVWRCFNPPINPRLKWRGYDSHTTRHILLT